MITNHDKQNHKDADDLELSELNDDSDIEDESDHKNELTFAVYSTFFRDNKKTQPNQLSIASGNRFSFEGRK